MSFLEFWGERVDPGKVGRIELGTEHDACTSRPLVWARFLFVAIGLPVVWTVAVSMIPLPAWKAWVLTIGVTLIYVGLSYVLRPEPDGDNLGWCGGFVDNPFRYSDDLNRGLLSFAMLLGPGRFIAESVADWFALLSDDGTDSVSQFGQTTDGNATTALPEEGWFDRDRNEKSRRF